MKKKTKDSPFMTVEEAAALLQFHVKTTQRLCREGKIKTKRWGRKWLVLKSQFENRRDAYSGVHSTKESVSMKKTKAQKVVNKALDYLLGENTKQIETRQRWLKRDKEAIIRLKKHRKEIRRMFR